MGEIFNYFKSICRHRHYVSHYCFMCHEYKRGIFHDISRFSPTEFTEMAAYYDGKHYTVDMARKHNGYSVAWLHHKGRNDHHYQYWIDNFGEGGRAIRMPYHQTVEMLCDYLGEGRLHDGKMFTYARELKFWEDKTDPDNDMLIHEDTQKFMDIVIQSLADLETKYQKYAGKKIMMSDGWTKKSILNERILKRLYDAITEHNEDKIENIRFIMTSV